MTLLELLKKHGNLELSLKNTDNGDKVAVHVAHGGTASLAMFEDIIFAAGGAITLVHLPQASVP